MKKIIGWFKNILMRILEVVNYMIKKDNEIELAKLEIAKELIYDRKIQIVLAGAAVGMSIGLGIGMTVSLLYIHLHNSNIPQNILAN